MKIVRIVKMEFVPEKVPEFLLLFDEVKEKIRRMDGCEHLILYRDIEEDHVLFTYSYWQSETHLEAYRNSLLFKETWAKTKLLFLNKAAAWSVQSLTVI